MSQPWWDIPAQEVFTEAAEMADLRQRQLTKPQGSLGRLEPLMVQLAGLQGQLCPEAERVAITVFAGDHGIVEEGISAYPQDVTVQMLSNFVNGGAAISVLAREIGGLLEVVNLGTVQPVKLEGVYQHCLGSGTANFLHHPAMTEEQCHAALAEGRAAVLRAQEDAAQFWIGGEMGIGNTTSATALACALLDEPVEDLVGPGTGLNAAGVQHKAKVITAALAFHRAQGEHSPLEWLRRVGGFEVAALTGAYIACAQEGIVPLVDGFICTVAALCAVQINPSILPWLILAHRSAEPGHRHVVDALGCEPLLDLGLCLGEGTGAALAVTVMRNACSLHAEMATFDEADVSGKDY